MMDAIGAHTYGERRTVDEPAKAKPLAKVEALSRQFESNPTEANLYALEMAAVNLRTQRSGGVALTDSERTIAEQYLADPVRWRIQELQRRRDGLMLNNNGEVEDNPHSTPEGRISAGRILSWIENGYAMNILDSVDRINETLSRIFNTEPPDGRRTTASVSFAGRSVVPGISSAKPMVKGRPARTSHRRVHECRSQDQAELFSERTMRQDRAII